MEATPPPLAMATVFDARPIPRGCTAAVEPPSARFARAIRTVRRTLGKLETASDSDAALRDALHLRLEAFSEELEALKAAHPSARLDDWGM